MKHFKNTINKGIFLYEIFKIRYRLLEEEYRNVIHLYSSFYEVLYYFEGFISSVEAS